MSTKQKIALLGATGSIGDSTLKVIQKHPERFELKAIAANSNLKGLSEIAKQHNCEHVGIFNEKAFEEAQGLNELKDCKLYGGMAGLKELVSLEDVDIVVMAIVGTTGLEPTIQAIEAKKTIALASKEIMVLAGELVTQKAKALGVDILPLDSEHSAIFQCLHGHDIEGVEKVILTASGGAFRDRPLEQLGDVTPADALKHPTWDMGAKVTIDCATMANKGLELIEAKWLFDLPAHKLDAILHAQSLIHCMVQFKDGHILTQMCPPDMTFPIQYALTFPNREDYTLKPLDLTQAMNLELKPVDLERYPCFKLAKSAIEKGQNAPAVFNAANEAAVLGFMENRLPFLRISEVIQMTLENYPLKSITTIEDALETHKEAYEYALKLI